MNEKQMKTEIESIRIGNMKTEIESIRIGNTLHVFVGTGNDIDKGDVTWTTTKQ